VRPLENGDPRSVGRVQLLARIGAGGMAIVYFGRSAGGRAVAVKVMHDELAADQDHRDRFLREVAAARTAGGQYSPALLDADPDASRPWLVMEFLPSVSLRDAVRRHGPLPDGAVRSLAAGLAEALGSIHQAGVLHLDVKPGNVLLTEDGPRLIDFGIAGGARSGGGSSRAGSPEYAAPEQLAGAELGPASDVFAYGATLAYALTGTPRLDSADTELRVLVERCLDRDPAARPTVAELVSETGAGAMSLPGGVLAEIQQLAGEVVSPPVDVPTRTLARRVRRRSLLAGGATLLAGGAVAAWWAGDGPVAGTARPDAAAGPVPTTTAPVPPIDERSTTVLEFVVTGQTTVYSLTTTVDGQAETVTNVALPWRRTVDIPGYPQQSAWRIDYHHSAGSFHWQVLLSGFVLESGGGEASHDVQDFVEGTAR
jgi:protein kinase-like protein